MVSNSEEKATEFQNALKVIVTNAARLYEDAKTLEEWDRFPTSYALAVLSQEEYGKAFIVHLVADHKVPWTPELEKVSRNHLCKQLVALVLEYINRKDFLELMEEPNRFRGASSLPSHVFSAIEIVVYEHVRGWPRANWVGGSKIDPVANRIARGVIDREKQTGFYVHLGDKGQVKRRPDMISRERCHVELARAERVSKAFYLLDDKVQPAASFDWEKIVPLFQVLLGEMPLDEFNQKWWT